MPPIRALKMRQPAATGPDANTKFLWRATSSTPVDEILGTAGTLVGNAYVDTTNKCAVFDGSGDWITFAATSQYDISSNWTFECHLDVTSGQGGGIFSRQASGSSRYCWFKTGSGAQPIDFYDNAGLACGAPSGSGWMTGSLVHAAIVRDASAGKYYIYCNGVKQGEQATSSTPTNSSSLLLYLGTDIFDPTGRDVQMRIGRVKISNVARYPGGTTFTPPAITAL